MSDNRRKDFGESGEPIVDYEGRFVGEWIDLLCKDCDNNLVMLQMNEDDNKLKIICSKCGEEEVIALKGGEK